MVKRKNRVLFVAAGAVLALSLIFSFSFLVTKAYREYTVKASNRAESLITKEAPIAEQIVSPTELSSTFRKVAKTVKPTVVNISVVEKVGIGELGGLRREFPDLDFKFPGMPRYKQRGNGSGVVVTEDGYIITNNHVVGKAANIEVKLSDGRKFKGKVIGTDPETDIAVVKIDAPEKLPIAKLGDSDQMEQGDWVLAIGSPFQLEQTITAGIVSAKERRLNRQYDNFIQTDASINPGNSGGPLVNMKGEVIGINTMIYSETGGNEGIGFAVPSRLVNSVYTQLVGQGRVIRGYLGVTIDNVTPEKVKALELTVEQGAFVNDIQPSSPASKAGLQSGDIVVKFDGKDVRTANELTSYVAETPVGKKVEIKFLRDGKLESSYVQIAERKQSGLSRSPENLEENPQESDGKLGITASTISESDAAKLKIKSGVKIEDVTIDSPAAEGGLRTGDVIHKVNRQNIVTVSDFLEATKSLKEGDSVIVQVERAGQLFFQTLKIE